VNAEAVGERVAGLADPTDAVLPVARASLQKHARSFRIAAWLLGPEESDDAAICYALCREADDLVDEAPSIEAAKAAIGELSDELHGRKPPRPLVVAFYRMALRRRVDVTAMWTLVDTIAEDAGPVRLADDPALLRYAYGVAGTVGILMAGLLGARSEAALKSAVDLGIGMQLSNVARDVGEDALRDRVYLPATRLAKAAPVDVVRDLVALGDQYYASGAAGLRYLPWRARFAVAVASSLYQAIGHAVVRRGAAALESRTVLARPALALAFARGLGLALLATLRAVLPGGAGPKSTTVPPNSIQSRSCPTG
jgi:phytoene synthase